MVWLNGSIQDLRQGDIAAVRNSLFVEYIPSFGAVFREPVKMEGGYYPPSQEPGLGVAWDPGKLDRSS